MNKYFLTTAIAFGLTTTQVAFPAGSLSLNGSSTDKETGVTTFNSSLNKQYFAYDYDISVDNGKVLSAGGDLSKIDRVIENGKEQTFAVALISPARSAYGSLNFSSSGTFIYTVDPQAPAVLNLTAGQNVDDVFAYYISGNPEAKGYIRVHITGTTNNFKALNDEISIDSQTKSVKGSVAANDDLAGVASTNVTWGLSSNPSSQYGFLSFSSTGEFTYNLFTDKDSVQNLSAGDYINDVFSYTLSSRDGRTTSGNLTVHIAGNPVQIKAIDDQASVDAAVTPTISGNVLDNDLNVAKGSATLTGSGASKYGYLQFDSFGKFTYNLFTDAEAILALKPGDVLTDVFSYSVKGNNGAGTATANLTIRIAGNSSAASSVKAIDDTATLAIDASTANPAVELNVLDNDLNVGSVSLSGSPVGQYGFIVGSLSKDGKLTYRVDLKNTAVQEAIKSGASLTDTFSYIAYGKAPNQSITAQGKIKIFIVAGSVASFKAYDFVATVTVDDSVTTTTSSATASTTTPGTISGNLVSYNAKLLGLDDNAALYPELPSSTSQYGKYGYLQFSSSGAFSYQVNYNLSAIQALRNTDNALQDSFEYTISYKGNTSNKAKIIVNLVSRREQVTTDNVEIENNNNSSFATPLNSGNYMRGNLMNSSDRDWFFLTSAGNEILHVELCPQGFACYNQGAWVAYIFDGNRLTQDMQNATTPLYLRRDDNGAILNTAQASHMYLLYQRGMFSNALVGVINPCYPGKTLDGTQTGKTSVDIGIPTLSPGETRNYFIAISSPLQTTGSGTASSNTNSCSDGTTILTRPGPVTTDSAGAKVTTTQEYIAVYPSSDDQYTLKVNRTGVSPLNSLNSSDTIAYNSNTGSVLVPKVRLDSQVFAVNLKQEFPKKASGNTPSFKIGSVTPLPGASTLNPFMATFNPSNNVVKLPKVTVDNFPTAFSVDLRYLPDNSLELMSVTPVK